MGPRRWSPHRAGSRPRRTSRTPGRTSAHPSHLPESMERMTSTLVLCELCPVSRQAHQTGMAMLEMLSRWPLFFYVAELHKLIVVNLPWNWTFLCSVGNERTKVRRQLASSYSHTIGCSNTVIWTERRNNLNIWQVLIECNGPCLYRNHGKGREKWMHYLHTSQIHAIAERVKGSYKVL